MGFISWDCEGCGHPLLSDHAYNRTNMWMNDAVAILNTGGVVEGYYDGYGHIEIDPRTVLDIRDMQPRVFHAACWKAAGEPTEHTGESRMSADQGFFFTTEHDIPPPETP